MRKPKIRRPSAGLVLGALALIVAVAGNSGAFAGTRVTKVVVRKGQIAKGAVGAKALAQGAVHPAAISKGAVTAAAIKGGAVTGAAIAPDSVTAPAIAPGSVYGGALGEATVHSAAIADADVDPHNGEWTASSTVTALCATGERLLSGGIAITSGGNNEVEVLISQPSVNGGSQGWTGRITSDAGGLGKAEVQALCLK